MIKFDTVHDQITLYPVWNSWIKFAPERETILAQRFIKDQLDTEQERRTTHPLKRASFLFLDQLDTEVLGGPREIPIAIAGAD